MHHVSGGGSRREELGSRPHDDRGNEIVAVEIDQGSTLIGLKSDRVEDDVDVPRPRNRVRCVRFNRVTVECIDL